MVRMVMYGHYVADVMDVSGPVTSVDTLVLGHVSKWHMFETAGGQTLLAASSVHTICTEGTGCTELTD